MVATQRVVGNSQISNCQILLLCACGKHITPHFHGCLGHELHCSPLPTWRVAEILGLLKEGRKVCLGQKDQPASAEGARSIFALTQGIAEICQPDRHFPIS